MLFSWIVLAIGELSATNIPLFDLSSNAPQPTPVPIAPGEPSTLIQALIGTAIIAAYVAFTRRARGQQSTLRRASGTPRVGSGRKAA